MRIKEIREDNDLKQITLCKLLNITQQQYSLYELEKRQFKIDQLIKLAKYFNTSIDYIVELTDNPIPYPRKKERWNLSFL